VTGGPRPGGGAPSAADLAIAQREMTAACPMYQFWWEPRPACFVLVAKRLPDASCHPHTVVTPDIAEMRAVLGIAAAARP
jgi:hypothetical protein